MKLSKIRIFSLFGFCASLCAPSLTFAGFVGGTVTYAPVSTSSVPALSEWGLIALIFLLGIVSYRYLRTKLGSRPIAAILMAGVLSVTAFFGGEKVLASYSGFEVDLTILSGGTTNLQCNGTNTLVNLTSVTQQVTAYSNPSNITGCSTGTLIAPQQNCSLSNSYSCSPPPPPPPPPPLP